jgi:two-component system phosphate regulon sensor histidine kinase PhoR
VDTTTAAAALCAALLDALRDPALLVGPDTRLRAMNAPMRALLPAARAGDPLALTLRSPDVLDAANRVLEGAAAEGVVWRERVPVERVFDAYVAPLTVAGDRFVVLTLRETTEALRVERMRSDFIANVSHELRTPLASVMGFIETLQGPAREDPAARVRFLAIMRDQARRMSRLIDDLLSLSRIEQRAHLRPNAPVDLVGVVRHVADGLDLIAMENRVTLKLETPDALIIPGDRDELIRLVENLVGNAITYGSLPDQDTAVEITLLQQGDQARLSVRDHGQGIAREDLPRLTERFYRADVGVSRAKGGTGLGLALVKHIVARHRGRLVITSQPGEGACFEALLPKS